MFEKLEKRLIFKGTMEAITPLHVGSGEQEFEVGGVEMPVLTSPDEQPYIPGSSLKGRVRTEAERIAREEKLKPEICQPPDVRSMCGSSRSIDNFCICCKIFGTAAIKGGLSVASKVKFRDMIPLEKVGKLLERTSTAIDREKGSVHRQALYTIQAVPAGTKFGLEIVAENMSDEELKLLLGALQSVEDSALGGSSTRGFGKVRFNIESVTERTAKFYLGKGAENVLSGEEFKRWFKEKRGF